MSPAFLAWVRYYVETEAFDRTLDGWWSDRGRFGSGVWIPVGGAAMRACEENAWRALEQIPSEYRLDKHARHDALDFAMRHHTREAKPEDVLALAERAP